MLADHGVGVVDRAWATAHDQIWPDQREFASAGPGGSIKGASHSNKYSMQECATTTTTNHIKH